MRSARRQAINLTAAVLAALFFNSWAAAQCKTPSFGSPIGSQALNTVGILVVGDFNNDAQQDLIISGANDFKLSIMIGSGGGTFRNAAFILPPSPGGIGNTPEFVATGDLNNDGSLDLVVTHRVGLTISVITGRGDGSFNPPSTLSFNNGQIDNIKIRDLNNDGNADIVASIPASLSDTNGQLIVFLGKGGATFGEAIYSNPDPAAADRRTSSRIVGVANVNSDNLADLVLLTNDFGRNSLAIRVVTGQGDGKFDFSKALSIPITLESTAGLYDVNADGRVDIVVIDSKLRRATVRLGRGDGSFNNPFSSMLQARTTERILIFDLADFDSDGKLDLAVKNVETESGILVTKSVSIYSGRGVGTFGFTISLPYQEPTYSLAGGPSEGMAAADFNNDGRVDLASGNYTSNKLSVQLNMCCPTIRFSTPGFPNGTVGVDYSHTLTATGGVGPYTFSLAAGQLPAGLTLSEGGVLSGRPTASGTFNLTVTAKDANGCPATARTYRLTIVQRKK